MILKTLTASFILCLCTIVQARNDYLQGNFQQCNTGDISIYSDFRIDDSTNRNYNYDPTNNSNSNRDGTNKSIGVRWTHYLGSNCTDYTKGLIQENMELAQQLELMKVCKRYAGKKLPPQFYTLSSKCKGLEDMGYGGSDRPSTTKSAYDELLEKVKLAPVKPPKVKRIKDMLPENQNKFLIPSKTLIIPKDIK